MQCKFCQTKCYFCRKRQKMDILDKIRGSDHCQMGGKSGSREFVISSVPELSPLPEHENIHLPDIISQDALSSQSHNLSFHQFQEELHNIRHKLPF